MAPDTSGTAIAGGRYLLEEAIGRGGMAVVHRAVDTVSGQRIALKQLRPRESSEPIARSRELFEREFHTLAQLAHPRIVAVIDYGIDGDVPYYTMELLDGGDLLERSPVPWRQACAFARDLCSALSLVHSRRMVYRDLSPRNVRCTSDGKAKLLDFGAMAPMGPAQFAVCTPSVASPEVVYRQPLDGRSDLYALGATLYFMLTGRSAYPARSFHQLIELWRQPIRVPSEVAPDVPPALDALVMDLLQLDPQLRPASAAEVSERLAAIAGLASDEQLLVAQAYLKTPTLVGRERELEQVDRALARVKRRAKGAALLVRGPAGVGRSRFLDACVLAGKLAGLTVVRVAPDSAPNEPHAVARTVVSQLLEAIPEETVAAALPHRAELSALLPALRERLAPRPGETVQDSGSQHGPALLRSFLIALARRKPLLIAVDDIDRFDADSRALCALLAHEARGNSLIIAAAVEDDAAKDSDLAGLLAGPWSALTLAPLDLPQAQALLVSMFGDVPHVETLTLRLHALAAGNPQDLMRLAQHLLDRGLLRYDAGGWVLPDRFDGADLPATMAQAYQDRIAALDDDARALARAFAQCPEQRFVLDECLALTEHRDAARTFRSLDRLLSASVIAIRGDGYALASRAFIEPLSAERDLELELRLARVFAQRGDGLRAARYLFRVGREAEGLDVLVEFAGQSHEQTSASSDAYLQLLSTLPHDWFEILETGAELCVKHNRPARDRYRIQLRMSGLLSQNDRCSEGLFTALLQRNAYDAGLDIYAQLDPALPPGERIKQALAAAAARYAQTPEHERVLDPKAAIGALARNVIASIGNFSRTLDVAEWRQVPSLAPLAPLSPAVAVVDCLARGFDARVTGRFEAACEIYRETLALIDDSDGGGLDPTFVDSMRAGITSILGMMESVLALPATEEHAAVVEQRPLYQGSALAIRMLYKLWQGDVAGADRLNRQRALWRLEQPRQQHSDVLTLLWTLQAHAASDDLTHTRHDLEAIERIAAKLRTWQPIASWARGEYARIRGDHAAALDALDAALAHMTPAGHQAWALVAGARLKVLCDQQRFAEARADGQTYLTAAEAADLGYAANYIRMPLAIAAARLGDAHAAWLHARAAIDGFEALGARGLNLGLAYETAARVAAIVDDDEALAHYGRMSKQWLLAHPNPALATKYQRLSRTRRGLDAADDGVNEVSDSATLKLHVESTLLTCSSGQERLQRALQLLVAGTGADRGYLYGVIDGTPTLCARTEDVDPPVEIESAALRYLEREIGADDDDATKPDDEEACETGHWTTSTGHSYRPVLLNHADAKGFFISGLVVLAHDGARPLRAVGEAAALVSRIISESGDLPAHAVSR